MINLSEWFLHQLSASAEGLAWAVEQVPLERQHLRPPRALGEWSAARHIFHMGFYEQTIALPSMQQWLGGPLPPASDPEEDAAWNEGENVQDLVARFQVVRQQQIELLPQLTSADWVRVCDAPWGPVTLLWVVTKTYQHTAEHIHDVLRIALFWEHAAQQEE